MAHLICIQGDTLKTTFTFTNVADFPVISNAFFTCKSLNLNEELEVKSLEDGTGTLNVSSDITKDFRIGDFKFDITVKFEDENIKTVLYNGTLVVKQKVNTVTGESSESEEEEELS